MKELGILQLLAEKYIAIVKYFKNYFSRYRAAMTSSFVSASAP